MSRQYGSCRVTIPAGSSFASTDVIWHHNTKIVLNHISVCLNTLGIFNIITEEQCYIGDGETPVIFTPGKYSISDITDRLPISLAQYTNRAVTHGKGIIVDEQIAKMTGFPPQVFIRPNITAPRSFDINIGTDIITIGIGRLNLMSFSVYSGNNDIFQYMESIDIPLDNNTVGGEFKIYLRDKRGCIKTIDSDVHIHLGYYTKE